MSGVVIAAKNRLDGKIYDASIVPKQEMIEYLRAPTSSPGGNKPRRELVTLRATATSRRSIFAFRSQPRPRLIVCYGLGRLEFDAFCTLVLEILSTCDIAVLPSAPNRLVIDQICDRHGVIADQGELRAPRSLVPFFMLFDRDFIARGY